MSLDTAIGLGSLIVALVGLFFFGGRYILKIRQKQKVSGGLGIQSGGDTAISINPHEPGTKGDR